MSAFDVYRIYLATKLHFTTEKYDVVEQSGRVRSCTEDAFLGKPLSKKFAALSRALKTPREAAQFFIACFAYDADVFDSEQSGEAIFRWNKNKEMMTQLILDDIERIGSLSSSLEGAPCPLQQMISGSRINIETAVALNRVFGFSAAWKNNFAYRELAVKIEKLNRFVRFNETKVNEAIQFNE